MKPLQQAKPGQHDSDADDNSTAHCRSRTSGVHVQKSRNLHGIEDQGRKFRHQLTLTLPVRPFPRCLERYTTTSRSTHISRSPLDHRVNHKHGVIGLSTFRRMAPFGEFPEPFVKLQLTLAAARTSSNIDYPSHPRPTPRPLTNGKRSTSHFPRSF